MTTEKQEAFLEYWAANREELAKPLSKIMRGLPAAALFVLPIVILIIGVYVLSPEWYTKVAPKDPGTFYVIFIALLITAIFIAYFRMQFKWENNEEYYQKIRHSLSLKSSENKK